MSRATRRRRWIWIGSYWQHYVMVRNWGCPWGYTLDWRGAVDDVFQPVVFADWSDLQWAVNRRLALAGLALSGGQRSEVRADERGAPWVKLWVEVERT